MAETFGVEGRGAFYEEAGAIRTVIQHHLLQLVALLTMEAPGRGDLDGVRDAKAEAFKAMRAIQPEDVVRGQYNGYRDERGVAPDSTVETYAALGGGLRHLADVLEAQIALGWGRGDVAAACLAWRGEIDPRVRAPGVRDRSGW